MAVDQKKIDKLAQEKVTDHSQLSDLADIQGQIGAITAERENALAQEQLRTQSSREHLTTMRTALEMNLQNSNNNQVPKALPPRAAGLRPETQQILSQYGVNANISESNKQSGSNSNTRTSTSKSSNSSASSTQQVTNTTTINNITTNNNKTETKVEVKDNTPKMAQTFVPTLINQNKDSEVVKFKTWVNNEFARQDEKYNIQTKQYEKRELNLRRNTEKLIKKLGDVTKSVANKLDPKNLMGNNLKNILMVVLGGLAIKYWKPMTNYIGDLVNDFKLLFGAGDSNRDGTFVRSLSSSIAEALGFSGDSVKERGFFTVIKDTIKSGIDQLWDNVKLFFDERKEAVRDAWNQTDLSSSNIISGQLERLGRVLAAGLGGYSALEGAASKNIINEVGENQDSVDFFDRSKNGTKDNAYMDRKLIDKSVDYDAFGRINESGARTSSNALVGAITSSDKSIRTGEVASYMNNIADHNSREDSMINKDYFTKFLGVSEAILDKLNSSGLLELITYKKGELVGKSAISNTSGGLMTSVGRRSARNKNEITIVRVPKGNLRKIAEIIKKDIEIRNSADLRELENYLVSIKKSNGILKDGDKYESDIYSNKEYKEVLGRYEGKIKEYSDRKDELDKKYEWSEWNTYVTRNVKSAVDNISQKGRDLMETMTNEQINNAKIISQKLKSAFNFTDDQIKGILSVLYAESRLNPKALNKSEYKKNPNTAGRGIAQWSNERSYDLFRRFMKDNYGEAIWADKASLEQQLEFMIHELKTRPNTLQKLKESRSSEEAADVWLRGYENGSSNKLASESALNNAYKKHNRTYKDMLNERIGFINTIEKGVYGSSDEKVILPERNKSVDNTLYNLGNNSFKSNSPFLFKSDSAHIDYDLSTPEINDLLVKPVGPTLDKYYPKLMTTEEKKSILGDTNDKESDSNKSNKSANILSNVGNTTPIITGNGNSTITNNYYTLKDSTMDPKDANLNT